MWPDEKESWIGKNVRYLGFNRPYLANKALLVINENVTSALIKPPGDSNTSAEWCGKTSLQLIEAPSTNLDATFMAASGGVTEVLENEITRLKARLAELEQALKTVRSL